MIEYLTGSTYTDTLRISELYFKKRNYKKPISYINSSINLFSTIANFNKQVLDDFLPSDAPPPNFELIFQKQRKQIFSLMYQRRGISHYMSKIIEKPRSTFEKLLNSKKAQ